MNDTQEILIIKHFSGETTLQEEAELQGLLASNSAITDKYQQIKTIWDESIRLEYAHHTNNGLALLHKKISARKRQLRKQMLTKIAAVFAGFIALSTLLWLDYNHTTYITANQSLKTVVLPDSSVVVLNKNAKLAYKKSFIWKFNRNVTLTGEAYFDIEKYKGKKFTVNTRGFDIEVLGTKFNVNNNAKNSAVVLEEGTIRLFNFSQPRKDIYMSPNQSVNYNNVNHDLTKTEVKAELYTCWKEKYIRFDDFTLDEVAQIIKQLYGKDVIITNKKLYNKTLSGSAPIDDLKILLKALSEILNQDISNNADTIVIN